MAHHKRHRSSAQRGFAHKTYKPWKRNGVGAEKNKASVRRALQGAQTDA